MDEWLHLYGVLTISFLVIQILIAFRQSFRKPLPPLIGATVSITIPTFNEPPSRLLACIKSILRQQGVIIREIWVVDDGSTKYSYREIERALATNSVSKTIHFMRFAENKGKRVALAHGFRNATGKFLVTVDSDTKLTGDFVLERLVAPFANPRIGAVTGQIQVANSKTNLLTELLTCRYWNAFQIERAAQSAYNKILCCSGPLSAYRKAAITPRVISQFVTQRFGSNLARIGDDRHLTNMVLAQGFDTVLEPNATCRTHVPTTVRAFLRQQLRWNRSFYRETLWTLKFVRSLSIFLVYALSMNTILPILMIAAFVHAATRSIAEGPFVLLDYTIVIFVMSFAHSLYGLVRTRDLRFLKFVLYGPFYLALLLPIRVLALVTLNKSEWGTR